MEEFKSYTRSVSLICLGLGVVFTLFTLGSLTSFLMIFVFQTREVSGDITPTGMLLTILICGLVGGTGLASFFMRKSARGWNLARIFGGILSLLVLSLPWLLESERPGVPPVASLGVVCLSFAGMWVFQVTSDIRIRAARATGGKS